MGKVKFTEQMKDEIASKYETHTSAQLAEEYGCSRSTVLKVWGERGLKGKGIGRQYYCNFNYFENIDTPNKAYMLGFISADGCVYKREGHQGLLSISLSKQDTDILSQFREDIGSNQPLLEVEPKGNKQAVVTLAITSDKIFNDLSKYNVTPRKTWSYVPKGIPEHLFSHFLRGYFDGDGSLHCSLSKNSKGKPSSYKFNLVGNKETMMYFKEEIESRLDLTLYLVEDKREYKGGKFYSLSTTNKHDLFTVLRFMYSNVEMCGSRKLKNYLNFLDSHFLD